MTSRRPGRCPRIWAIRVTPGSAASPDGTGTNVTLRCRRRDGHKGKHRFERGAERLRP